MGGTRTWAQQGVGAIAQSDNDTYLVEARAQLDELHALDPSPWRFEKTYQRNGDVGYPAVNEGMALGFMRISSFSSTTGAVPLVLLNDLGYGFQHEAYLRWETPMPAADALLGVRYVASEARPVGLDATGVEATSSGARVWENPWALGLGYGVADTATTSTLPDGTNPFEAQNAFASALVGHEVQLYRPLAAMPVRNEQGLLAWNVIVPAGSIGYVYPLPMAGTLSQTNPTWLSVDGGAAYAESLIFNHSAWALGDVSDADAAHTVALASQRDASEQAAAAGGVADAATGAAGTGTAAALAPLPEGLTCIFYALDPDALTELTDELRAQELRVSSFGDDHITGTFTASEGTHSLLVTIPNADGWSATVNGRPVKTEDAFGGALMVIPVTPGENDIELRYLTPGLVPGCVITALAALSLVIRWGATRRSSHLLGGTTAGTIRHDQTT